MRTGRPSMKIEITCETCGKPFFAKRSAVKNGRKYCSPECYIKSRTKKITKKCAFCGKEFQVTPSRIHYHSPKYCSKACSGEAHNTQITKTCEWCKKEFSVKLSHSETKFCSWECSTDAKQSRRVRTCTWCGKKYLGRARDKTQTVSFCSHKCFGMYNRGENNGRWMGGISFEPYCNKFNNEFKRRVRAFFGYRCVICGKSEDELNRRLLIHHVNYDKMTCCNDAIPRFAAVCNRHNAMANRNRDRREHMFNYIIDEIYNGRCYFTPEEFYANLD